MKLKWFNHIQTYHLFTLLLATLVAFGCFFIFEQRGSQGLQSVATIYESALLLEELNKENLVSDIEAMVQSDRSRIAIKKLEDLYSKSENLNNIYSTKEFQEFKGSYGQTHKLLSSLIQFPEIEKITSVLHEKMVSFEKWVTVNGWPTLTRISRRLNSTLSSTNSRGKSFYQKGRLLQLIRNTKEEIERMNLVTKRSTLSTEDKEKIFSRTEAFAKEVELLGGFVGHLNSSDKLFTNLKDSFSNWKRSVDPMVALSRLELEKSDQVWKKAFLGFGSLFSLFFVVGLILSVWGRKKFRAQTEKEILDTIQNGLFPYRAQIPDAFSSQFVHQFSKQREFFHKRVVFGTVFQEAVPFSCFLLDSNLNLVWGNDLFYKHWSLSKDENQSVISWDYLQKTTNLGEDDPVLLALKQGIAGIYQVQMKTEDSEEGRPYEMYVSPVEYSEQKRIMIFLYPLSSLQDTIQDQIRSMIGPMRRAFEALTTEHFDEHKGILKKDFEVAGIGEIFLKLENYHELVQKQKNALLSEIHELEGAFHDQIKVVNDSRKIIEAHPEVFKKLNQEFLSSKETILKNVQAKSELDTHLVQALELLRKLLSEEKHVVDQSFKATELMKENIKAFSSLGKMRDSFKEVNEQIKEVKSSVTQGMEKLIVLGKRESKEESTQLLGQVRDRIKSLESFVLQLEKLVRTFDVGLSKVEMMLGDCELPNTKDLHQSIKESTATMDKLTFEIDKESEKLVQYDDELIVGLKNIHRNVQGLKDSYQSLDFVFSDGEIEIRDLEDQNNFESSSV